jgi:hypothetical protein
MQSLTSADTAIRFVATPFHAPVTESWKPEAESRKLTADS